MGITGPENGGTVLLCFGCRDGGMCHLGVTREQIVGDTFVAQLVCPPAFEGGPTVAHGGWTAAAFDEVLGHTAGVMLRAFAVTATIQVEYLRPIPVGAQVEIRAAIESFDGRRAHVSGEMTLVSSGAVIGRASGEWAIRDFEQHFTEHWQSLEGGGGGTPAGQEPGGPT